MVILETDFGFFVQNCRMESQRIETGPKSIGSQHRWLL
jgi:hypothetical protein